PVASTAIAVPESASDPPRSVEKISPRPSALNFVTNASGQADTDTNRLKGQLSAFAIRGTALFNGKSLEFVLPARYTLPSPPMAAACAAVVPLPPSKLENSSVMSESRHPITNAY